MMMTKDLDDQPTWNTALRLPLVTDDSELFELQILLGGITLVLSRLLHGRRAIGCLVCPPGQHRPRRRWRGAELKPLGHTSEKR
jgi:hypothetical protein